MAPTLTKAEGNYRRTKGPRQCGNCSMYRQTDHRDMGRCTLVKGVILPEDVCDKWESKK